MPRSSLELTFDQYLARLGRDLPSHEVEYAFAKPRRWRFDYCWPEQRVAVELEGGVWIGGRHNHGAGFEADAEKYNAATVLGYRVLRYTATMLKSDPMGCIEQIRSLLRA